MQSGQKKRVKEKIMSDPFNDLSAAEAERLAILSEECAEIIQAVSKILRHGYENYHPYTEDDFHATNRKDLEREIGDVSAVITMMVKRGDLKAASIEKYAKVKPDRMEPYLHEQPLAGAIMAKQE